jgi:uncharacterized protein (TIGR00730 family)
MITVAVFGSSEPRESDAAYETARRLGALLAQSGMAVLTGGYGGVMEAASRGASEAGGHAIGVGCEIFEPRKTNTFLDEVALAPDLFTRTRDLVERANGYVILPGKAGTLAELAMLWALDRAGCLEHRPVVLLGRRWSEFLRCLSAMEMLEPRQIRLSHVVAHPDEAVAILAGSLFPPDRT